MKPSYILLGAILLAGFSMFVYELPELRRFAKMRALR